MTQSIDGNSKGLFVIAPTPFLADGTLDLDSARSMCDFFMDNGANGITILGIMGEAPKLSFDESVAFTGAVLEHINDKIPVIVGVSSPAFSQLAQLSQAVREQGAAGVMIAPMPTLKTDDAIYGYFKQATELTGDIPVCLQDYPQTLGVHFSSSLLVRIFKDMPTICMLKHEDAPGLAKLSRFREQCSSEIDRRISVLVGNGGLYLPQEMARGADGAMTGFAFPEMLRAVIDLYQSGDASAGEDLFDAYLPMVRHELQPGLGLAIRKYVLKKRGAIASDTIRSPGPSLSEQDLAEVDALWHRLDQKLAAMKG